jgi:hypothetical protein
VPTNFKPFKTLHLTRSVSCSQRLAAIGAMYGCYAGLYRGDTSRSAEIEG